MTTDLQGHKIGFVGLGNMGAPMARHLHAAGAEVMVWNRSEGPVAAAVADGLAAADSPKALAQAVGKGIICLNLTTPDVVEEVVFGKEGLANRLDQGALIIDFGTSGVPATKKFAQRVLGGWVDAPVSGGQVGAESANLTIMAGGSDEDFARALPLLEVVGEKITHMGPVGSGQVTKLANQLIVAQTIDAVAQALRMAELAGVDSATVREALLGGFAESRILDLHGERMVNRAFEPGGRSALQLKDVRLICELSESVGLESSTLSNCREMWENFVVRDGNGDLDHSGLFRVYE
jgi:2-hydroxy-3-oxopropionate reductase